MKDLPTAEDLEKAEQYAMSKLCIEIPSKYGRGLTSWNNTKCSITRAGCTPGTTNPISREPYDSKGNDLINNENDKVFGSFWKYYEPGFYVMKTTKSSPKTEVCTRGNFLLKRWCEYPGTRNEKPTPGITEPNKKFDYAIKNGKETCIIPKEYCDSKQVGYSQANNECIVSTSQKQAEWFLSPALVRSAKASDMRLKTNIRMFKPDFPVKGINLYSYTWKPEAYKLYGNSGNDIGFVADNLPQNYIYIDTHGYKNINIDLENKTMYIIKIFLILKKKYNECIIIIIIKT